MKKKYSIFHIDGGLGKHIAATAVAKCIKNNYPDRELIVVCAWPQVFIELDFVHKVFRAGYTSYFYQDYILDADSLIFKGEPYFTTAHIYKQKSLIENWCEMHQLKFNKEKPELRFNHIYKQMAAGMWKYDKPVLVIQSNGGPFNDEKGLSYKWTRDIPVPVVQSIVNYYSKRYTIFQVCRPNSFVANGAQAINSEMNIMEMLSILLVSEKRLLIDSSLQHAAAALQLPSTVLWVGTSPKVFGYDLHTNISAKEPINTKFPDSHLFDYNFEGLSYEYPYGPTDDIFDLDQIVASLNK
jgi:hypothetical protein